MPNSFVLVLTQVAGIMQLCQLDREIREMAEIVYRAFLTLVLLLHEQPGHIVVACPVEGPRPIPVTGDSET